MLPLYRPTQKIQRRKILPRRVFLKEAGLRAGNPRWIIFFPFTFSLITACFRANIGLIFMRQWQQQEPVRDALSGRLRSNFNFTQNQSL